MRQSSMVGRFEFLDLLHDPVSAFSDPRERATAYRTIRN